MTDPDRYMLTVDLTEPGMPAVSGLAGILVAVELATDELVYPVRVGGRNRTLYPTRLEAVTDEHGRTAFSILPSSVAGAYRVSIGRFRRVISMPAEDSSLGSLPEYEGD